MLKFSMTVGTRCSGCSLVARHGFYSVSQDEETCFLCSSCAQREYPLGYLQGAVEAYQVLSDAREVAGATTTPRPIRPSEDETIIRPIPGGSRSDETIIRPLQKARQDETIIHKPPSSLRGVRRVERTKNP
jgi:hypothetical protein